LARFVAQRDDAAFTSLVRRHGPMVMGVCTRLLNDVQEAEDAFQATFLVLVRRAGSIGQPDLLGNWLYGVAYRTALKARGDAARRRRHQRALVDQPSVDSTEDVVWRDLRPILDEELDRLAPKYRVPFVLCHLEGHTHEEIARQLGCPRETVTTRLCRARERLRTRLARRGLALSLGVLIAELAHGSLSGAVPAGLADATVRAAVLTAAGQAVVPGVISIQVATLTEGVVKAMWMSKIKLALAGLLAVSLLAWGVGVLALNTHAQEQSKETNKPVANLESTALPRAEEEGDKDEDISVKGLPPAVVKTIPMCGDTQVDADKVKEIRVTYSKDMTDKSWSWSQISNESFPPTSGKPSYDKDKRTAILPVKLAAGKTYVIWLNSEKFGGFKDTDSRSAVPYLLVFETKK